jgi:hypothetical protein
MARDLVAKSYRLLAGQCRRDAEEAQSEDVREAYEKLADEWIKLAVATERNTSDTRNVVYLRPTE